MATVRIQLKKQDNDFHFRAQNASGHTVDIDDASAYPEGRGKGVGPMQMLIMAIGGCSGVDIMSILKKGRQVVSRFDIEVTGEKPDGVSPSLFTHIHIRYDLDGDLDVARVRRAIELSLEKYCSVAATLEKTAKISYEYSVNGQVYAAD